MPFSSLEPSTITTIGTAIAGIIAAYGTYRAGKRKQSQETEAQKHSIEQDAANALMELNAVNKAFRDEVRSDLRSAQDKIAQLEAAVISKDRIILELQSEIARLRFELDRMKRDGQ